MSFLEMRDVVMNGLRNRKLIELAIDNKRAEIKYLADWLFDHPEIALQEVKSAKFLAGYMRKQGFEVTEQLAGMKTAWKGTKKRGTGGPKICFMAEFDALPVGHACGHHMIAAMSIGAACSLANVLQKMEGEVSVIGTPAEETGEGKTYLIDQHMFDTYDLALMLHPCSETALCPKVIAIGGKDFMFTGKAAHAGVNPADGINALDAAVIFFNNINALRQQIKDGSRIHGMILEAGRSSNTIPDTSKIRLEWRSKTQSYFDEMTQKIEYCARSAALATGCQLESNWFEPICKGMRHSEILQPLFADLMNLYNIEVTESTFISSTDTGNVSQIIPTLTPLFQVSENNYGLHTKEFRDSTLLPYAGERLILGAKILALAGLAIFENEILLEHLREEKRLLQESSFVKEI